MKCPKCQYLGFETGDRCKNCGYDFSLIEFRSGPDDIRVSDRAAVGSGAASEAPSWDRFDSPRDLAASGALIDPPLNAVPNAAPAVEGDGSALPLFALTAEDQPLVRLPVTPRRPLAVRRTPENPRFRAAERPAPTSEPELDFPEEAPLPASTRPSPAPVLMMDAGSPPQTSRVVPRLPTAKALLDTSSLKQRCIAATIDYTLLFAIDFAIVYFTVRMAGLDMADWRLLPILPLALFLVLIAMAYVGVFTAIGGQTIGKMVAHIRVVSDDEDDPVLLGATRAFKRTAAMTLSWMTVGLGFLPAFVGDHRALHDRLSGTRVVNLESA